jgi:glycosyltransferase involved in cell wall biosynthesis
MKRKQKIFAVIAALNEEKHISEVIRGVKKYISNIIVVDDGSTDKTSQKAITSGAFVLRNIINCGKGNAIKTGCDYAVKNGATIMLLIDGDMQHDPDEIPKLLKALKGNDIVFGYREFKGQMPIIYSFGNWFINFSTRIMFGINLKDTQCGYRAFTRSAYKNIRWKSGNYSMESEMIANASKSKLNHSEVRIKTIYQDRYKGTTIFDGVKIVLNMILWRLRL